MFTALCTKPCYYYRTLLFCDVIIDGLHSVSWIQNSHPRVQGSLTIDVTQYSLFALSCEVTHPRITMTSLQLWFFTGGGAREQGGGAIASLKLESSLLLA